MKAVRYLIILSLISSMNFSGQKMLQIFKQKVVYVMYACFMLFLATGCATTGEAIGGAGRGLQRGARYNQQHTQKVCRATPAYYNNGQGDVYNVSCY